MTRGKRKYTDDLDDGYCGHGRAGIVTNQPDGYDKNRSHAACSVCADPKCRARALAWVRKMTGEDGVYVSDSSRRNK